MSHRNIKYLNDNRIAYRKYSEDQPTQEYKWGWYYADGTHGYIVYLIVTLKLLQ